MCAYVKVLFLKFTCNFRRGGVLFSTMTGAKNGKISNRELHSTDRNNVKHLIDVDLDGESNEAIENSVSFLFVET
jgi:hypothetical protein